MKHGCLGNLTRLRHRLAAVAALLLAGHAATAGEIRIWPTAAVKGKDILLGDIAELSGFTGDSARNLSETIVHAAPCPGGELILDTADARTALMQSGCNLAETQLIGAARCKVFRTKEPKSPARSTASTSIKTRTPLTQKLRPAATGTLESALHEYIAARLADHAGRIDVRFSHVNRHDLALSSAEYQFNIEPKDPPRLGLASFDVKILHPDEDGRVVPILAEIALVREVVSAKREINRGQTIEGGDLAIEERRFTDTAATGIQDLNLILGQRAREFIRRGELINEKVIEPKPIVHRGEAVTIWMRQSGLVIKAAGRAQQAGGLGDKIEVRREGTRRKCDLFEAIITGPRTVTIGESTRLASR